MIYITNTSPYNTLFPPVIIAIVTQTSYLLHRKTSSPSVTQLDGNRGKKCKTPTPSPTSNARRNTVSLLSAMYPWGPPPPELSPTGSALPVEGLEPVVCRWSFSS